MEWARVETVQLSEGMQWAALAPPAHEHHGTMRRRTLLGILEKSRNRDLNQLARETCPDNRVEAPDDGGVLSWGWRENSAVTRETMREQSDRPQAGGVGRG